MDDTRDHKVTLAEFQKGVNDFGTNLTKEETTELFNRIDKDNNGYIDIDEFIVALRASSTPPMSQSRLNIISMAFKKLDKNGSGVITASDMKGVYSVLGHPKYVTGEATEEDIFNEFLKTFEIGNHVNGIVTKEEFLDYYAGVSASIDSDVYFDLMMRKAWKL
ncbi:EF hand [Trichuris suis]|nr:EF hand [Trichuris suis]